MKTGLDQAQDQLPHPLAGRPADSSPVRSTQGGPTQGGPTQGGPNVPVHVAFIMDGNGRWAQRRGLSRLEGHQAGVDRIQAILEALKDKGVKVVTVYAFSTENWRRPQGEVEGLMDIFSEAVGAQTIELHEKNVRIVHVGQKDNMAPELRKSIADAEELTRNNTAVTLNVAFDYGGRAEITEAVRRIIRDGLTPEEVDEETFSRYLFTAHCPDPDLIVRTAGEQRISNFLLWQSAYSEYYHTPTLWPDLGTEELDTVLEAFANRRRRYGRVDSQG